MTPKEKAKDLFDKFNKGEYLFHQVDIFGAIEASIIAVDEIIDELTNWTGGSNNEWDKQRINYWLEVKKEIEKL